MKSDNTETYLILGIAAVGLFLFLKPSGATSSLVTSIKPATPLLPGTTPATTITNSAVPLATAIANLFKPSTSQGTPNPANTIQLPDEDASASLIPINTNQVAVQPVTASPVNAPSASSLFSNLQPLSTDSPGIMQLADNGEDDDEDLFA